MKSEELKVKNNLKFKKRKGKIVQRFKVRFKRQLAWQRANGKKFKIQRFRSSKVQRFKSSVGSWQRAVGKEKESKKSKVEKEVREFKGSKVQRFKSSVGSWQRAVGKEKMARNSKFIDSEVQRFKGSRVQFAVGKEQLARKKKVKSKKVKGK
ncbi:MAG: hypothetical protein IPH20_02780 [Bacteroidales bacterium]|nr:hypothetical protein [Bacteroidales bacterium]